MVMIQFEHYQNIYYVKALTELENIILTVGVNSYNRSKQRTCNFLNLFWQAIILEMVTENTWVHY